jgi:molecular chaperone DnaK (HSP70)
VTLVVGIDLGTTHTVVAWADAARAADIRLFEIAQLVGPDEVALRPLLPSFLYAALEGERAADPWRDAPWTIGEHARRRGQEVPGRLVTSAKSWLSHSAVDRTAAILPWGNQDEGSLERISPVDASARILRHVRRAWDSAHPRTPLAAQQIVLTVPASFDQAARELTLRAANQAGLEVRLLEEPQAAFYDFMARAERSGLDRLLADESSALVLVCDVGGGTTDLTLIRVSRDASGAPDVARLAVGRHLLLGGDNMDLALAHTCERRLVEAPLHLEPKRFAQLVLACRAAKERLLGRDAPDDAPVAIAGVGSALVGNTLSTRLSRTEVESIVLEGFLPPAARDAQPQRGRAGLLAFGLPYEHDPALTRHVASFFARHAPESSVPRAVLLNGGVFHAERIAERLVQTISSWGTPAPLVLPQPHPDLAVARGAVAYGLSLAGHGLRIGGGAAHGFYVGVESMGAAKRAICVVPRGTREGERQLVTSRALALRVGRPVRFELYASDSTEAHAPGQVVSVSAEDFELLPPLATRFEAGDAPGEEVSVLLEGELTPLGTLELACVQEHPAPGAPRRRFRLAFELRGTEPALAARSASQRPASVSASQRPAPTSTGRRFDQAVEAVQRVFGKGRTDVAARETKDLVRELERLLGERASWTGELTRQLFDVVAPKHKARKRSADHERVYWMLTGYCIRPGFGHPLDPQRIALVAPLFEEGLTFSQEARAWSQFWIAGRRMAGGLAEEHQLKLRDLVDPFLAPDEAKLRRPKNFKPQALDDMLEMASWLERVPVERRGQLGRWILERTWTDRDPRLWAAVGRLGARVPVYASVHHVIPPRVVERWLDDLLREKWEQVPTAPRAAMQLARVTGDRARDLSEPLRQQVVVRLERAGARAEWIRAVRELVPVEEAERAEFFGEELPVGLRLVG